MSRPKTHKMRTWTNPEAKADSRGVPYPEGPWMFEPDKAHWVDPKSGMDCLIHRGPMGALCGYVGVPPGHPLHGLDYSNEAAWELTVHGGLTYANACQDTEDESSGICHVPFPGRPHDVWWFGFDCAHSGDVVPGLRRVAKDEKGQSYIDLADLLAMPGDTYKDFSYVKAQTENLARQLAEVAK